MTTHDRVIILASWLTKFGAEFVLLKQILFLLKKKSNRSKTLWKGDIKDPSSNLSLKGFPE
jgi:hypothetical protein